MEVICRSSEPSGVRLRLKAAMCFFNKFKSEDDEETELSAEELRKLIEYHDAMSNVAAGHGNQGDIDKHTKLKEEARHRITSTKSLEDQREMFTDHIERCEKTIAAQEQECAELESDNSRTLAFK